MKNFYKIVIAFILIFCVGFLISYFTISSTLNEDTDKVSITKVSSSLIESATKVS